ncbi:MAG TPA: hypothetical protein VHD95_15190 [Rhizomicrobium sp.]|nr:hypothetical protein [Rhizomicrobium sp.]
MSELLQTKTNTQPLRWRLFATVSSLALAMAVGQEAQAGHADQDRPTLWIELGGQLDRIDTDQSPFAADFMTKTPTPEPFTHASPIAAQRPPRWAIGGEGKITIAPEESDWVFSAGVRYGRASSARNHQFQSAYVNTKFPNPKYILNPVGYPSKFITATAARLSYNKTRNQESYAILDFQAGKDVGLGVFGGSSVISAGVRYAAFNAKSDARITARPTAGITAYEANPIFFPGLFIPFTNHNEYFLSGYAARSFHGVGPSLAWNASAPVLGNADDGEIVFDWGVNAAILFGRQKASGAHRTTGTHYRAKYEGAQAVRTALYSPKGAPFDRSRSVAVPNLGAFAGLSFRYVDAKVSFGYRADYFFGAMDVGIDTRKTSTRGFHGPFAKISVGLGG